MSAGLIDVGIEVNGEARVARVHPMARLLDVLRGPFGLTGSKEGCGEGECGACGVFIDGVLTNSCLVPAIQAHGARVETIEGLARGGALHPVQEAFLEHGGAQCGICTPGMVMAAVAFLREHEDPATASDEAVRGALGGNLCRCTGYVRIIESVVAAARAVSGTGTAT